MSVRRKYFVAQFSFGIIDFIQPKFQEFEWVFVMKIIFYFHSRCDWYRIQRAELQKFSETCATVLKG